MEENRRFLNVLKGLLIILVVVGHFGQTIANNLPTEISFVGQGIVLFVYSFHMPLFLFVSGYLSKNSEKRRKKAFEDLFIPYVLFQLFVGLCILILTKSGDVLQNFFVPQMGAWYLLTLFSYRIVLPETKRIRGIINIGILLTVVAGLCTFDKDFAIKKTLGFFVYFISGYRIDELPNDRVSREKANCFLIIFLLLLIAISWKTNWYRLALSILSRGAGFETFERWYLAPALYCISFVITSIVMTLVLNAIPKENKWLEEQGTDTMPMYLSHLILFMAVSYLVNKNNWVITVGVSVVSTIFSIWIFSREWYRKAFNCLLSIIKTIVFREE